MAGRGDTPSSRFPCAPTARCVFRRCHVSRWPDHQDGTKMSDRAEVARTWVSNAILETYNQCWADAAEPVLDAAAMAACLIFLPRSPDPDGDTDEPDGDTVAFDPGELFGGHIVVVFFGIGMPSEWDILG